MAFSSIASHLQQKLVRGTCNSETGCQLRPLPNQPMLSLKHLATEGLEAVEDAITPSWMHKIEEVVQLMAPAGTMGGCAAHIAGKVRALKLQKMGTDTRYGWRPSLIKQYLSVS